MMTDPIADMLTRIRNAVRIEREYVDIPSSKMKQGIADVLKREGLIWNWTVLPSRPRDVLRLELKYGPNGERVIRHIQRASKPGRRLYRSVSELRPVLQGLGVAILSTNRGILSDREARRQKVSGEVLCQIW